MRGLRSLRGLKALSLSVALTAFACGDDDAATPVDAGRDAASVTDSGSGSDTGAGDDATTPDTGVTNDAGPTVLEGLGVACPDDVCADGLDCYDDRANASVPAAGFCSRTCATDADCGAGAFCAAALPVDPGTPAGVRLCLPTCTPGTTCEGEGRICSSYFLGAIELGNSGCVPGNPDARPGDGCNASADCGANGACVGASDAYPFDVPGGLCAVLGCDLADESSCPEGFYCAEDFVNFCWPECMEDSDCRVEDGWSCSAPFGVMECSVATPGPGAACEIDIDCGPAVTPWRCVTGASFPGGYCGASPCNAAMSNACPLGAVCFDPSATAGDEFCAAYCEDDDGCRSAEGYRCLPVDAEDATQGKVCLLAPE